MARIFTMVLIAALLGGCVVVPDYYGYRGGDRHGYYWDGHRDWDGRRDGYRGWDGRR